MLHQRLWEANQNLAEACLRCDFVEGLRTGALDAAAFKRYVAQDAFFLRAFLRGYSIALAKAPSHAHAEELYAFMGGVRDELKLHAAYAAKLDIDLEQVSPLAETSAYTDFLLRTAWTAETGEILAAMTPCMRLYAWLGKQLAEPKPSADHPYLDWITAYSGGNFEQLAARIEALLDQTASDTPPVRAAYRYAMECELAFFAAPLVPRR